MSEEIVPDRKTTLIERLGGRECAHRAKGNECDANLLLEARSAILALSTVNVDELREAINDGVATLAAVRATSADADAWAEGRDHFHALCGETVKRMNAALSGSVSEQASGRRLTPGSSRERMDG